jgi:DNA-binding CsgD family transcriptional regulator
MSETEIAKGFSTDEHPFTTTQLRAARSIALNQQKQEKIAMAQRLKDKGYSNVAIGQRMGINESSVRALLAPGEKDKVDVLTSTADMLKRQVEEKKYLDVGRGAELDLPISDGGNIGLAKGKFRYCHCHASGRRLQSSLS